MKQPKMLAQRSRRTAPKFIHVALTSLHIGSETALAQGVQL